MGILSKLNLMFRPILIKNYFKNYFYNKKNKSDFLIVISCFFIVFFYELLWAWQGIDYSDTGWTLTKQWLVFNGGALSQLDLIFGSTFFGGLWNSLVKGNYLFWANLGVVFLQSLIVLITCLILIKYFNRLIVFLIVLSVVPLVYTPLIKVLNYNNIPAFFLILSVYFLVKSYFTNKNKIKILFLVIAGVLYAITLFCKFTLITFLFFPVLVIIYNFFVYKKKPFLKISIITEWVYFIAGFVTGLLIIFGIMHYFNLLIPYLKNTYNSIFFGLIGQNKEYSGLGFQHNTRDFFITLTSYYYFSIIFLPISLIFLFFCSFIFKINKKIYRNIVAVLLILLTTFLVFKYFNVYKYHNNIYFIIFALNLFILISYLVKSNNKSLNFLILLAIYLQIIINIGSLVMNWTNMYLSTPLSLLILFKISEENINFSLSPIKDLVELRKSFIIFIILIGFAMNFFIVYRDGDLFKSRFQLTYTLETNNLKFIHTTKERAEELDGILKAIRENNKNCEKIFCVNSIPMLYYLSQFAPVTKDPWAIRLRTYESFKKEVNKIFLENPPKIIVFSKIVTDEEKANIVWQYIKELNYKLIYENKKFLLYKID